MSSNCPPQLHLELTPNTTSFKRSFDQFGFDLESPLGTSDAVGASTSDGNDRNKRARSASSFSDDERSIGSSSSSTLASGSSPIIGDSSTHDDSMSSHITTAPRLAVPHLSLNIGRSSLEPPRLPTPEIQDIDMTDYPLPEPEEAEQADPAPQPGSLDSVTSTTSQAEESYRLSLERFNAFDTQISALRRSPSPGLPRSPTPPPVLPPLELLGEEVPIITNNISFLHPPAQPSPPLPLSLYSYGPPRNQQPGSRTTSRNDSLLDDIRRLPHETHTQPSPLAQNSTASRDLTNDSRTDEEWNRITQNVRSARGDELYRHGAQWSFWPPAAEQEVGGDDNGNEGDEEEEEEVQEVLEQPSSGDIWSSPVAPTLGELRSPSPLFNHLDNLDPQPPPAPVPAPASLPRRMDDNMAPPTLPPIEDQVLSQAWDVPMEEVFDTVWNRFPSDRMPQTTQIQQPQRTSQTPPPPPRIPVPSGFRERERTSAGENVSASITMGSVSDIVSASASAPAHAHAHALPSPFTGWLDHEDPWFFRAPDEEPGMSRITTTTSTNVTNLGSNSSSTSSNSNFNEASGSGSTAVSSSILDTYAASRLQALQGIGTALEGIGQVLRESELTLAPYLRDGNGSNNVNANAGAVSPSTTNATLGEGSRASRSPSVRSTSEVRPSAWRSTSNASASGEGSRQRAREEGVRGRMNGQAVTPGYLELDWSMSDEPSQPLPSLPDSTSTNETETLRNVMARMTRRLPSTPESLETLRIRTDMLEAAVRDTEERWPDRSTNGDRQMERSGSPQPLTRLFEPTELFSSPWGDNIHGSISTRRDRELPTNTSMLFDDGPSTSAFSNDSQPAASTTDRPIGSGWRTVGPPPVVPRVRDPPSRNTERERENERERLRVFERSRIRLPRTNTGASPLFSAGTSLSSLRARPYVSQTSTHAHGHSYSQLLTSYAPLSAGATESAADAQRRIARLGLMQMQRQRANSGRMPSADSSFSSSTSTFATRPLPPRPRGFDTFPPRTTSPDRHGFRTRLAEHRARIDGLRENDAASTTSNLYNAAINAAMDTLDLFNIARPTRNTGETSPERLHPTSGLRFVHRSFDRVGEPSSSDPVFSSSSSDLSTRRSRFPTRDLMDRPVREPPAEFLPVPSLPSPGLEFEFVPPASTSNGPGPSESHNDHHNFNIGSSRSEVSPAVPPRRSPSPVFRRRLESSQARRSPPPGLPRELDPEAFAPGPFRNTIQSLWSARNNRSNSLPRVSPTRGAVRAQPQTTVTAPSLPPLAFEEEHRPSAQRPGRPGGDLSSLYRNESGETSTAHLRAFLNRHPLPPPDRPPTPQRIGDILNQLDSPLDVLDRILTPQNNTAQSTSTSGDLPSDDRHIIDAPPAWVDGDNVTLRRPSTSNYRPPWRTLHPPRLPPNPPSDLHNFLVRHPRTEAVRREVNRRPPLRGDDDGFNHAIEALRNDGTITSRSQEFANRAHTPREARTWVPASPWGILEQSQASDHSRQTSNSNDSSNGESSAFQRRRRHPPLPNPYSLSMDLDDDDLDIVSFPDHARLFTRRFRGSPGGETPAFPRRVSAFMRSNAMRRGRPLGDYIRDEDWNSDYESLLSLAAQLGEVKSRSTPDEVIASLETGLYKDWKTSDSDQRCPICLDDYQPDDPVLKLSDCSHWLHHECLQQWLKGASTCPVCRETVVGPSRRAPSDPSNEAGPSQRRGPRDGSRGSGSNENGGAGASGAAGSSSNPSSIGPRRPRRFL